MLATFHIHYLGHKSNMEILNEEIIRNSYCQWYEFIESFLFWVTFVTFCIYIYKVSYIHSFLLYSTVMFFLHCMLEIWKNILWNWWVDCFTAQYKSDVIFWVLIVNASSLLCSIIFLSRKLCFLRSPCLLLIAESISLDISGKPTVGFFLETSSSS